MESMESLQTTETKPLASIILRSYNEEKHIEKLLESIFRQKTDFPFEVILVDSGSTDKTIHIAQKFPIKIIPISKEEFTFGRSLNRGIEAAVGDYCVMTSSHCFPTDEYWLQNIVTPFESDDVALVYGKQRGISTTKYSEHQIFAQLFPDKNIDDFQVPFCNNANAAIRRSVWKQYPYNEELTGLEDMDWAKFARSHGHKISYRSDANIFHIHEERPRQIYHRYYREAYAYKQIFKDQRFGLRSFLKFWALNTIGDFIHARQDGVFLKQSLGIIQFRFLQFWGTYRAHQYKIPVSSEMQKQLYYPKIRKEFKVSNKENNNSKEELKLIDITRPIFAQMAVWPGATATQINSKFTIENNGFIDSDLLLNIHAGTHIDAPKHFIKNGRSVDQISMNKLIGKCFVYENMSLSHVNAKDLERAKIPANTKKLLIKTANSSRPIDACFNQHFLAITEDAATWIANTKIHFVGIDGPSIQAFDAKSNKTHTELLQKEVVIAENLNLREIKSGNYYLSLYPLAIKGAEGAPARAFLSKEKI